MVHLVLVTFELSCQIVVERFAFEKAGGLFGDILVLFWVLFWVIGDCGVWWAGGLRMGGLQQNQVVGHKRY